MPGRYDLRTKQRKDSKRVNYRESEDEDSEEDEQSDKERNQSRPEWPNLSSSSTSGGRGSRMDSSSRDTSLLSSTASDSFSFHAAASLPAGPKGEALYPRLPSAGSPATKKRLYPTLSPSVSQECSPASSGGDTSTSQRFSKARRRPSHDSQKDQSFASSVLRDPRSTVCVVLIVCLLAWLAVMKLKENPPNQTEPPTISGFDLFKSKVDELRETFSGQNNRFWTIIKASARHVFEPDLATYPAILLMVADKKDAILAASVARAVSQEFDRALNKRQGVAEDISLNVTTALKGLTPARQKLVLDTWLKEKLDSGSAVVLNHLEDLHPLATLLLHSYCDGDNAPYKRVMIVLGLHLHGGAGSERAAEATLQQLLLQGLQEDKVGALLSRVANNIVLLEAPRH